MTSRMQIEAQRILHAQLAAERLLARATAVEHDTVMRMSRDEVAALAQQMIVVAAVAEKYHLEAATSGSLAPEVHSEPVT